MLLQFPLVGFVIVVAAAVYVVVAAAGGDDDDVVGKESYGGVVDAKDDCDVVLV